MNSHIEEIIQSVTGHNNNYPQRVCDNSFIKNTLFDKFIVFALCCIFLTFALWIGIVSSNPFFWPFNWDTLRDIGIAQTILDKTYPEDPILKGEINWYNPLTGAMLALFSQILHKPLPETCMRIGPFLQLLLPIAMLLLAWNRWGPWAGFLILTYTIFARHPYLPEWIYATYSPWLLAPQWGKTFFFITFLIFILYVEKKKITYAILCGLFLGVGFLAHTTILIEAGLIIALYTITQSLHLYRYSTQKELISFLREIGILLGIALIVSAPYWVPILIRYQFIIHNPYPSLYLTPALEWHNLPSTFLKSANGFTVIGVISLVFFFIHWKKPDLWWIRIWTVAVLLLIAQQIMCQFLHHFGYTIPAFFPPHHVFISAHALIGFWFTYGSLQLANRVVQSFQRWSIHPWLQKGTYFLILSLIFLTGIATLKRPIPPLHEIYRGMGENKLVHEVVRYDSVYKWILNNTSPEDIFLCDEVTGLWTVMPAGRKLTYTLMFYINPYYDIAPQIEFFNYTWTAFREQRYTDFLAFCQQKNVKYIILRQEDKNKSSMNKLKKLRRCYEDHQVTIYKVL